VVWTEAGPRGQAVRHTNNVPTAPAAVVNVVTQSVATSLPVKLDTAAALAAFSSCRSVTLNTVGFLSLAGLFLECQRWWSMTRRPGPASSNSFYE